MFLTFKCNPIKQSNTVKPILFYLLKFGGAFCLFYFGTLGIIGLSTPENFYNHFVATYLNFIDPLRFSLLFGSKQLLWSMGYSTFLRDQFTLVMQTGEGVRLVYSCIGYGVMSFWGAFIFANKGTTKRKILWVLGGLSALWLINVIRIALILLAEHNHWSIPLGWDHHTWFNIFAYALIFAMIYYYDRSVKKPIHSLKNTNQNLETLL